MAEKWGTKYFENIQAESDDQNFVQQVNEEPIQTNTDLCSMCKNPQNGTTIGVFSTMVRFIPIIVRHVRIIWIKKGISLPIV